MFKLFISKDSLTDLYVNHAASPTDWLKVIQKQRKLFLMNDESDIDADLSDANSMLSMFLIATGKSFDIFEPSSLSISDIHDDPARVLENPCGCYLLDIDKAEAESIQNNYGVICQSTSDYQDCPLVIEEFPISPEDGDSGYGWSRFGNVCSEIPSNALIINDRNLFANTIKGKLYGLENIEEVLNVMLPNSFDSNTEYHVGIIVEEGNWKSPYTYEQIIDELGRIKSRLNKPYKIIISFLAVSNGDSEIWSKTHNRRIISNYYYITADHKIAAFYNGKSTSSQVISLIPLFCKGMVDGADAPEKNHHNAIEGYRYIVEHWDARTFKFASGLNSNASIENINHRLLK